jgi:uncharacterized protein (DUF4415 family)
MTKKELTDRKGEVRELTRADIAGMRPFKEELPALHETWKRGRGRPPKEQRKVRLTVRLDADVVERLKQDGRGYQTRINSILREAMGNGAPREREPS